MMEIDLPADSPKARAKRIREIRDALRLSRPKFAEKLNEVLSARKVLAKSLIPQGTLQNWEEARFGGLSQKGAKLLVKGLYLLGTECTVEWLMYGTGNPPLIIFSNGLQQPKEEKIITQELKLFYQLNPNAIDVIIADDSMLPRFLPGDHVAGRRYFEEDIDIAIGEPCIIHTHENSSILVRILQPGNIEGLYTLSCTNPSNYVERSILENVKLFSAAPILWIRRKGVVFDKF
jgi:hypothetical protein